MPEAKVFKNLRQNVTMIFDWKALDGLTEWHLNWISMRYYYLDLIIEDSNSVLKGDTVK